MLVNTQKWKQIDEKFEFSEGISKFSLFPSVRQLLWGGSLSCIWLATVELCVFMHPSTLHFHLLSPDSLLVFSVIPPCISLACLIIAFLELKVFRHLVSFPLSYYFWYLGIILVSFFCRILYPLLISLFPNRFCLPF